MKKDYIQTGRLKQKQKTRQHILTSAQKLIEIGEQFSLEDVAKHANISRATIYRYFSSMEVLSIEAGLDINTLSPQEVVKRAQANHLVDIILNIQDYYNQLSLDHEANFRTYLSAMLNPTNQATKRGARRVKSLSLALQEQIDNLSTTDRNHLIHIATLLMGIEAFIVTKDVCGLNDEESLVTLRWGLKTILKAVLK